MTMPPRLEHPQNAFRINVLPPIGAEKPKSLVQASVGIRDARHVLQLVWRKEFLRFGVVVGEMHEGELRSFGGDLFANVSELGDRLAAKCSTKVPQKHQ